MKTLLLKKAEVSKLIRMKEVIDTVEEAYKAFNSGLVVQPDYIGIDLHPPRGDIDFKLGYYKGNEIISMKASSGGFPNNPATYGVPSGMGTILLFDARTCALICVMDGSLITGLRTGACGAVSVKALARKNAKKITSIGTGNQEHAVGHIEHGHPCRATGCEGACLLLNLASLNAERSCAGAAPMASSAAKAPVTGPMPKP